MTTNNRYLSELKYYTQITASYKKRIASNLRKFLISQKIYLFFYIFSAFLYGLEVRSVSTPLSLVIHLSLGM